MQQVASVIARFHSNPYPYKFTPTHTSQHLHRTYAELENGTETEDEVTVAGRIMAIRNSGMFLDVMDHQQVLVNIYI